MPESRTFYYPNEKNKAVRALESIYFQEQKAFAWYVSYVPEIGKIPEGTRTLFFASRRNFEDKLKLGSIPGSVRNITFSTKYDFEFEKEIFPRELKKIKIFHPTSKNFESLSNVSVKFLGFEYRNWNSKYFPKIGIPRGLQKVSAYESHWMEVEWSFRKKKLRYVFEPNDKKRNMLRNRFDFSVEGKYKHFLERLLSPERKHFIEREKRKLKSIFFSLSLEKTRREYLSFVLQIIKKI